MKKSSQKSSSFFYKRVLYKILILIDILGLVYNVYTGVHIFYVHLEKYVQCTYFYRGVQIKIELTSD